jgi:HEAT repeat protein
VLALCAALGALALAQDPGPDAAAQARTAIGAALKARQIPRALEAYDAAVAESGPSAELLAPIARADLGQCLDEGRSWNRVEAARALAVLGEERGVQALVAELRGPHSQVRARVALVVADVGLTEAIPDLKKALASPLGGGDAERVELARALYRLGEQELGRSTLAELSGSDDPRVRTQAVRGLVLLDDKGSLPTVRERMQDENEAVALWAARGAARRGDAAGRSRLERWMAGDNHSLRTQAAWHLRGAGVTDFVPAMRKLTESALQDPNVRGLGLSAYLLSWLDPEVGQPFLERALALERHLDTRMLAVRRLAELRHESALAQIRKIYQDAAGPGKATLRADLVRFAGWLGDLPQVREFLGQAAVDQAETVQLEALETLAGLGVADALGPLRELLTAPLLARQIRAAEALLHFGEGVSGAPDMWQSGSGLGPRWG